MEAADRTTQIALRDILMDNQFAVIRYRKNLKYNGVKTTKQGTSYHTFMDIDIYTNMYLINEQNEVFTAFKGKVIPIQVYRETLDKLN